MIWTPYEIEIILHHHCSAAKFPKESAPLYMEVLHRLIEMDVLYNDGITVVTTGLGNALVKMWLETPLPILTYVDPRTNGGYNERR